MTTLNREEITRKIDLSLYSVLLTHHGNDRDVDEELCKELAEAALDALIDALPTNSYFALASGVVECDKEDAGNYKQLLSLKRE